VTYVIQNTVTGQYLLSGPWGSYTEFLQHARVYETREEAEADCCGDERVLTLEQAMRESL
jgi:hypothetical protein